ncbi:anthranilate phosphoribosyltransferase [Bacillus solimangrovi]|uniref:Glycosyl transferase n=1 Tax=Bacillus solimangrovi TaxID=1305675 RepID=A0A1E5LFK7_9BACI|nr:glycosyl transferase [Bacillus solimangrovi]OEH92861.1 glycosyl transferase [Bacillus solimangrovi]
MKHIIKDIAKGRRGSKDLSYEQAIEAAQTIATGQSTDVQTAAFLIAQRMKEEKPEELQAFAEVFSHKTVHLNLEKSIREKLVDFASPYSGRNSFYATIPVSILLAERGIPVFLHSSDSLPPKYGTSLKQVFENLGIINQSEKSQLEEQIYSHQIAFGYTDSFCSQLVQLRSIREDLSVRTLFNTVEKLLNIAQAETIMFGAFHRTAINKILPMLPQLSFRKAFVVQGIEGSEDVPTHRNSFVFDSSGDEPQSFIIRPSDYHLDEDEEVCTKKLALDEQVEIIQSILDGQVTKTNKPYVSQVLLNAGLRYYLLGYEQSMEDGINYARAQLESSKGMRHLQSWKTSQIR